MLFLKCARHIFAFTCVLLHPSLCFFSRVYASKCLLFLKCTYIIMVAFIRVRLHQHVCFYSCALTSHFASTCARLHQRFGFFRVHPLMNVCMYHFAPASNVCYFRVCDHIKMSAFTRVRLHQNICFFYIEMVACHCVREHLNVSFFSCVPYQNSCFFSVVRLHRFFSLYLYLPISNFLPILVRVILNACLFECTLVHLL